MSQQFVILPSQTTVLQRIKHTLLHTSTENILTIVGEQGSGKSTICHHLVDVLPEASITYYHCDRSIQLNSARADIFQAIFESVLFNDQLSLADNYSLITAEHRFQKLSLFIFDDVNLLPKSLLLELYELNQRVAQAKFQIIFSTKATWLPLLSKAELSKLTQIDMPHLLGQEKEQLLQAVSHIDFDFHRLSVEDLAELHERLPKTPRGVLEMAYDDRFLLKYGLTRHKRILAVSVIAFCTGLFLASKQPTIDHAEGKQIILKPIELSDYQKPKAPVTSALTSDEAHAAQTDPSAETVVETVLETTTVRTTVINADPAVMNQTSISHSSSAEVSTSSVGQNSTQATEKPTDGYTIQLVTLSNAAYMKEFAQELEQESQIFVLKDRHYYLVVQGHYATKAEADLAADLMMKKYQISKPWVRSWSSLQQYPVDLF